MPQIFPKALNPIAKMLILAAPLLAGGAGVTGAAFYRSSYATGLGETPAQPVAFSHAHHVGQLGIHCVYCHTSVESSGFANIPPTKTCMNCHQQIWQGADLLEPVRNSYKEDKPIEWARVHNLPHYAYFNHSIHVAKGVGCATCHGRLDQMNLTRQNSTLLMEWCIACHRAPEKHLRPKSEVFNMQYDPSTSAKWTAEDFGYNGTLAGKPHPALSDPAVYDAEKKEFKDRPTSQKDLGLFLKDHYNVRDAVTLTNCSMCHR